MRFAIYVRKGEETFDKVDEVPQQLRVRQLAVSAFDANGMMTGWELPSKDYAARRCLCLPSKSGATSRMKRSISSFTCVCGFMPTLK